MKAKNSSRKHGAKLSFVVDREEIDINSDWVSAVLRSPATEKSLPSSPETATVIENATVEQSATVAQNKPVVENTPVVVSDTVEPNATVAMHGTEALFAPVALSAPVEETATVEVSATHTRPSTRKQRPRAIRSILDGFTPGQFTVYSLMWHKGEDSGGAGKRLFSGGYRALCDLTGMSKRGVQNVISELQDKQAISIHQAPGYHRTQCSVYQVLSEERLLQLWQARGFKYAVGKGKQLSNTATVD